MKPHAEPARAGPPVGASSKPDAAARTSLASNVTVPTFLLAALAVCPAFISCGRPSPAPGAAAGNSARPSAPASASFEASAPPPPASREGDGCWGVDLPAAPAARLEALGARCAPGLRRVFDEPPVVSVDAAGEASVALPNLPPGACVRTAAVASGGAVSLALVEGAGDEVARDGHAAFALAPLDGPLCLGPDGRAALRLRRLGAVSSNPPRVWVQAWSSAGPR